MSYYDPRVYNKQNLHDKDLNELEYWHSVFENIIANAFEIKTMSLNEDMIVDKMKIEIMEDFCKELKTVLGIEMQENVIGIIDNYDEDVEKVEDYETFHYKEME